MTSIPQSARTKQYLRSKIYLAETHPHLVAQWSVENTKAPDKITQGSSYRAVWTCPDYSSHSWDSFVYNRVKGQGCPYCNNSRVLAGFNDLTTLSPEVARSWDYERNFPLTPADILGLTEKKAHWICEIENRNFHQIAYQWDYSSSTQDCSELVKKILQIL